MLEQTPDRTSGREHLYRYPVNERGAVGGYFHAAVRAGASTPSEVVAAVQRAVLEVICNPPDLGPRYDRALMIHMELEDDPAGARAFAQECIEWNQMPKEERDRLKAERAVEHAKAHMAQLPVTEKQVSYLQALGYTGPAPGNRLQASELIDALRGKRQEVRR